MRILRLFTLMDLLRARRAPITAADLAERLSVAPRTVYRDVAALQALGAPIRGEAGVGYQLEPGYFLPPLNFDANELDALTLGLKLAAARGDEEIAGAAASAAMKIGAALSDPRREAFRRSPLAACSVRDEAAARVKSRLALLRRAVRERRKLQVRYRDLQERVSDRLLRPLGLTAFDQTWLLTAWCERRDGFRNFRLDRLEAVEPTQARFPLEKGKRFEDFLAGLP